MKKVRVKVYVDVWETQGSVKVRIDTNAQPVHDAESEEPDWQLAIGSTTLELYGNHATDVATRNACIQEHITRYSHAFNAGLCHEIEQAVEQALGDGD